MGAGAGGGHRTTGYSSPSFRLLAGLEWSPAIEEKPVDRDGDGVLDKDDACPDVPGIKTDDPKTNGCPAPKPSDRDGDGIVDADDACPDVAGVKSDDPKKNGCPADRDGDGIYDADDACPDVPGVKSEDPKKNGCPPDKDADGIYDADDACPDVPGVKSDDPKKNGCPSDKDGDGIVDAEDACPDVAGIKSDDPKKNGCPALAAISNGMIKISEQVQFKTGSATILAASDNLLTAVLGILKEHTEITKVHIEGHTDNKGNAAANNKTLSDKRAKSVMAWLQLKGVDKARMDATGYGQERPLQSNDTDEGRQANRRVEFKASRVARHPEVAAATPPPPGSPPSRKRGGGNEARPRLCAPCAQGGRRVKARCACRDGSRSMEQTPPELPARISGYCSARRSPSCSSCREGHGPGEWGCPCR